MLFSEGVRKLGWRRGRLGLVASPATRLAAGERDKEEREEVLESVVLEAHETRCSPCNTGPDILRDKNNQGLMRKRHKHNYLLGITIKFSALIDSKDEIHLRASTKSLIENAFVMPLSCPQPLLNA